MAAVSEIWVKINSDISGLQRGLLASGTELKAFSATASKTAGTTSASAAKIQTSYGGIGGTISKLGPVFIAAGAAAVTGIFKGISATQQWAGEVKTLQRVTGQSAEDASRLATAADTLGISTTTLATGFGLLGKNIINGSANLQKYGVVTKDASGATLPFNDILGNIQDKFLSLPKGIEQATFAQNVFGRGGKALIPILSQGRAGLAALEAEADKYGTTLSQKDLDASRALTIAQKQLGEAFKGAEISIGRDFIPILTSMVTKLTSVVEVIHAIPQPVLTAGLAFVTLAGGAAAAGKVIGFLQTGWTNLGNTLGVTSKVTETATTVLDENTAAVVGNTAAQGSWGIEVNSAANSISTASDVIDAGTKATEASTTAVTADIAAQAAHSTAVNATAGAVVAQVEGQKALFDATLLGTGAVGDAAAAQGVLFDATNLTTAAIERQRAIQATPIPAAGTGAGAGLFALGNSALLSGAAVLFGLAKSVGFAKEEFTGFFRVLAEHQNTAVNVNQGLGAISKGMQFLGFAVPSVTDNIGEFTKGVQLVQAGLQDGSITFDQARTKVADLGKQYGIDNLNVDTFTNNLATSVGVVDEAAIAATKHTRALQAQRAAIHDLITPSGTVSHVLGLMGESATQFGADARKAFVESDTAFQTWAADFRSQAVAAWQQFRDSAKTSLDFSTAMLKTLESNAEAASQKLGGDTSGLSKTELATLKAQANVTAADILHTFQAARRQIVSFGRDLLEIGKVGGQAGKDLAASFLAAGDVISAQVVADAPRKLQEKIVGAFGASETAADRFSTKLTNAIVGPLKDISGLLEAIARHFGIDVSFLDHGSKGKIDAINTSLRALAGRHRGEIDIDTTQAMARLTALIARERQAIGSTTHGTVSPRQIITHSGGLITPSGVRRMHAGGAVKRMHAGGAAALAADATPSVSNYGVRPPPTRNGQMWMGWASGVDNAHPKRAMGWWNDRLKGSYVREHTSPSLHVAADLAPYRAKKYLGYTDYDLRQIHLNPIIKTTQDPAWLRVLKHEMGHAFGLGHVTNPNNLMDRDLTGEFINATQVKQIKKWFRPPTMHAGGLAADEVPAVLQVGEFVVQKRAVDKIGLSNLFAMNQMHTGGAVVPPGASPVGGAGLDEAALERAFRKALRAEREKLYVDRRRFGRDLDQNVLTDGHW